LPTDVADAGQVEAAATAVEDAFGPIDVSVNNAMVSVFSPVKQMEPDEYRRVTEVT
jgi:NAD(P)-dependent dehydrogenase (short-subunit alcohol dehydrogenase family)